MSDHDRPRIEPAADADATLEELSTVGIDRGWRTILKANNRRGTFDNLGDTRKGLGEILEASFERVELETVGSMAIFAATNPRMSTGMTP
jgi:hypothetical protein